MRALRFNDDDIHGLRVGFFLDRPSGPDSQKPGANPDLPKHHLPLDPNKKVGTHPGEFLSDFLAL
jgi:hypothetical protein